MNKIFFCRIHFAIDSNGNRIQIEHGYHRGEHYLEETKSHVDGYMFKNDQHYFMEYLGCSFHPDCCVPDSHIQDAQVKRDRWEKKKAFMKKKGTLITMRSCAWKKILRSLGPNIKTEMGDILYNSNEQSLLDSIKSDRVYGFLVCDVETPKNLIESYGDFLFPWVIKRHTVTQDILSAYTRSQCSSEDDFETVIQCYNGKQLFILSTVAKFYMAIGVEISNVTKFIQYVPNKALQPFVNKVINLRAVRVTWWPNVHLSPTTSLSPCHLRPSRS